MVLLSTIKEDPIMDINERRFYSPKEIIVANGGILPMSISAVYAGMRKNMIPYKTIGKRKLIPGSYLKSLLEDPMQADKPASA